MARKPVGSQLLRKLSSIANAPDTDHQVFGLNASGTPLLRDNAGIERPLAFKSDLAVNVKDAPYGAVGDGVADDSTAIESAINAANGRLVWFPAGIYKVTRQLALTVTRFSLGSENVESQASAASSGNFRTRIVFTPTAAATKMLLVSGASGTRPGPFRGHNICFDLSAGGSGIFLGDPAYAAQTPSDIDNDGQANTLGVDFQGCGFIGKDGAVTLNADGTITRTGQTLLSFTKVFQARVEHNAFRDGDVQLALLGCDRPMLDKNRHVVGGIGVQAVGSGSYTVDYTLDTCQFEGQILAPVVTRFCQFSARDVRVEPQTVPTRGGTYDLSTNHSITLSVTADSATATASASVDNIILPYLTPVEITSGGVSVWAMPTAVSGTSVTFASVTGSSLFAMPFTDAAATIKRVTHMGAVYVANGYSSFGWDGGSMGQASNGCPYFVLVPSYTPASVRGVRALWATQASGSVIVGNKYGLANALEATVSFDSCAPEVLPELGHPLALVGPQERRSGDTQVKSRLTQRSARRVGGTKGWIFEPNTYAHVGTSPTPIITRLVEDSLAGNAVYAWRLAASGFMGFVDDWPSALPMGIGGLACSVVARSVSGTAALYWTAYNAAVTPPSNSAMAISTNVVSTGWGLYSVLITSLPAQFTDGARTGQTMLRLSASAASDIHIQHVSIEEIATL